MRNWLKFRSLPKIHDHYEAKDDYTNVIFEILDHLCDKMESISQEQIDKDSFQLGRYRTYKQVFEFIQSLSQPKIPVGFEHIDTITTDEGTYPEWVGQYIYNN